MKRIRDAQTIIGALEGGEVAAELSTTITDALAKLKEMAGNRPKAKIKGKVGLKLHFTVEQGTVTVEAEITQDLPKKPRSAADDGRPPDPPLTPHPPPPTDQVPPTIQAGERAGASA